MCTLSYYYLYYLSKGSEYFFLHWMGACFCSIDQLLKQSVSVWRWRRQGERKERKDEGEQRVSHPHDSPQSSLGPLMDPKYKKTRLRGVKGDLKTVHLHLSGLRSPPSCMTSISVVEIYHHCAPSSSSCCFFPQGISADISVRWLGVLVCNSKLTGEESEETLLCREKLSACKTHRTRHVHFMSSPHRTRSCRAKNYICLINTVVLWVVMESY